MIYHIFIYLFGKWPRNKHDNVHCTVNSQSLLQINLKLVIICTSSNSNFAIPKSKFDVIMK